MNQRQESGVAKPPALLLLLAVVIFLAGAVRYYRHGNFTLAQGGYCLVSIPAALLTLLVYDYTVHHAKLAAVMVLIFAGLFLAASPAFCVGLGLALAGMVVVQRSGAEKRITDPPPLAGRDPQMRGGKKPKKRR